MSTEALAPAANFIRHMIAEDLSNNKNNGEVVTRFPPEPNGYLHIGHAKSICLNFGVALENRGITYLRFDDTNPAKESMEYVEAIQEDVRWLGYSWGDRLRFASDYFDQLHGWAVELIENGKAYVDSQSPDAMRANRGTLTEPGTNSPDRDRSIADNLNLFARMKAGEFEDGSYVLRAKIDMTAPNLNLRDPVIYRIVREADHYRTGKAWSIYPMYDFTHGLSDAIEGVTHSLCTLEFEDHRPLYNWFLENVSAPCRPEQTEFARLLLNYTVMSKRKLNELVTTGLVNGWDDPRIPTIRGLRRRGFTPASIRNFCERIGVTKKYAAIEMSVLENAVREDLGDIAPRVMAVLKPLKVVITNYPEDLTEEVEAKNHPGNPDMGTRTLPFSREIYIEQDDFMEDPPKKFFRLGPGREVRLRYAYIIKCENFVKDENGNVAELHCTYDAETRSGMPQADRKVKGTIHWVSAAHAVKTEVRLYDRLFLKANPDDSRDGSNFKDHINPDSVEVLNNAMVEPALANAESESRVQFERTGYFCVDSVDSKPGAPVFNRTVTLRDSWAKIEKEEQQAKAK